MEKKWLWDSRGLSTVEVVVLLAALAVMSLGAWSLLGRANQARVECAVARLTSGRDECRVATKATRNALVESSGRAYPIDSFHPQTPFERPGTPQSQLLGGYADTALLAPVLHPVAFVTGLAQLGRLNLDIQSASLIGAVEAYVTGKGVIRHFNQVGVDLHDGWKRADYYEIGRGVGTITSLSLGTIGMAQSARSVVAVARAERTLANAEVTTVALQDSVALRAAKISPMVIRSDVREAVQQLFEQGPSKGWVKTGIVPPADADVTVVRGLSNGVGTGADEALSLFSGAPSEHPRFVGLLEHMPFGDGAFERFTYSADGHAFPMMIQARIPARYVGFAEIEGEPPVKNMVQPGHLKLDNVERIALQIPGPHTMAQGPAWWAREYLRLHDKLAAAGMALPHDSRGAAFVRDLRAAYSELPTPLAGDFQTADGVLAPLYRIFRKYNLDETGSTATGAAGAGTAGPP